VPSAKTFLSVDPTITPLAVNANPTGGIGMAGGSGSGQTLSVVNTLNDADGMGEVSYQWFVDASPVLMATAPTFTTTTAMIGKTMTVAASYVDGQGYFETVSSSGLAVSAGSAVSFLAYSWKNHTLLDGVALSSIGHSGVTNAAGLAAFSAVTDATLTLNASRPIPTEEVIATSSAVNLQDAIAILKMIVGLPVNVSGHALSPYQALAADYDGNGTVGLADSIGVLKYVVGLSAPNPTWHFTNELDASVPGKANISPGVAPTTLGAYLNGVSQVHVGLVGYLTGDADGSFPGSSTAQDLDVTQPNYFSTLVASQAGLNLSQFGIYS
jgi:hypothetical protein